MDATLSRRTSDVQYARHGAAHVAYRVVDGAGTGAARDVVMVSSGTMAMDSLFRDPVALRMLEGLADLGRLVLFDRRGIGLSDPPDDWDVPALTRWREDIEAVVAAADVRAPVLFTSRSGAAVALLYGAAHPDDGCAIAMFEPQFEYDQAGIQAQIDGEIDSVALFFPSRADEPGFREWFVRAGQTGASPAMAARVYPHFDAADVDALARAGMAIRGPVVVLRRPSHRSSPPRAEDPMLALVPTATRVDVPGEDILPFGGEVDAMLAEVARFVTGELRVPAAERSLAAVLYTDVVGSTDRAAALGDAHWKRLIDRHDAIAHACIGRRGGSVIKTMGDGVLAVLGSASSAVHAAQDLRDALREENLEIRVGVHVGDIDRRGDDISGMAVVIAARLLGIAGPGEILASTAVVAATAGEPIDFDVRGDHVLKGVPGTWPVVAVTTNR